MNELKIPEGELTAAVESFQKALTASRSALPRLDSCKDWPAAKVILPVLSKVPALAWIVSLLITVGDAYAKKHCPAV